MQADISAAPRILARRPIVALALAAAALLASVTPAGAQLDQLSSLKRVPPNVIVIVDTSLRMLEDGEGNYYDPNTYRVADGPLVAAAMGVGGDGATYRRRYVNLRFTKAVSDSTKFEADNVFGVGQGSAAFDTFWRSTRFDIAQRGLARAVELNKGSRFRWGLMKLPQSAPSWRTSCDKPVTITANPFLALLTDSFSGCSAPSEKLGVFTPTVSGPNSLAPIASASLVPVAYDTAATVYGKVTRFLPDQGPDLIPTGGDTSELEDRPLARALQEAKARVAAAILADTVPQACPACRNTVVVLLAGGRDYLADPTVVAQEFLDIDKKGRRVPIYVVGIKPPADAVGQLQGIATNSGGLYFSADEPSDVTRAVNLALQAGFGRWTEFNAGQASEYIAASPVVGTVNLDNALDWQGTALPNTIVSTPAGQAIPQRNNIMVTPGYAVGRGAQAVNPRSPGFDGRLRAFRVFKPEEDSTKPAGYTFTKDGTPLWPDRDGQPHLAGMARRPADPGARNIYTYLPGRGIVRFSTDNGATLADYLRVPDTERAIALIEYVAAQPLGAIIGSTPAVMDPPSIDPPPDTDYGKPEGSGTYAANHKDRRSIIWVGANDGMLHAIDARTGYEVWAFIPFNLLPKLRTLTEGQPVEQFNYFVDNSAKIAEVKLNGQWRTCLVIGEGPGGTFYQAFDVTEAGMGGPPPTSDDHLAVLQSFADPHRVEFMWAFPSYGSFDHTIRTEVTVADATPGNVVRFYGDLNGSATAAERSVGFTWSDPAVGPLDLNRSVNVAIVGSGYFPSEAQALLPARVNYRVGHSFYLIRMEDGTLLGNSTGSACDGSGCIDVGDVSNNGRKNALQADPTVTGDAGAYVAKRAYMGDVDGSYWRFNFDASGAITARSIYAAGQPIYGSSALMTVGTLEQYVFFATGSDMLPTTPASAGGTGTFKLFGIRDLGATAEVAFEFKNKKVPIDLAPTTDSAGIAAGERPSASPSVAGEIVFFTTTVEPASGCADARFNLWALTYRGGTAYGTSVDPKVAATPAMTGAGRATAPFVVDQHLYFGTSGAAGASVEAFGDPDDFNNGVGQVGVRILSWREIRR